MSDIPPISNALRPSDAPPGQMEPNKAVAIRPDAPMDRVEISEMGQMLSTLEPETDIRVEKVTEIREAILNGTYETPEKIDITVDHLWEILRQPEALSFAPEAPVSVKFLVLAGSQFWLNQARVSASKTSPVASADHCLLGIST